MENSKIEWTDHTFNPAVRKLVPLAITVTPKLGRSELVLFDGEIIRVAGQLKAIGKDPSNGTQKLAILNGSTAIGHVFSVRRLPTCSIIRWSPPGAKICLH
jgi:hypothetical protein